MYALRIATFAHGARKEELITMVILRPVGTTGNRLKYLRKIRVGFRAVNDFQTEIDIFLYRLKTPQCRISRDMKKMTRAVRSIREMMKNHIQAMEYLSMHGRHCRSHTGKKMTES